ncbi:unnamed protein product [Arctia plantaginis]|uniref:CN hydrolase domain-containing protein n=1 Tax=Arctia plantaginis TaxID=874455 RepID=A0A8S0YN26_ARCPL|nr:unnamed protein product [Arctia plantaginis]
MKLFSAILVLAVVGLSSQRSTPADDHYVAAVVEYIVNNSVEANKANYEALIEQAAQQNADVIVFPELTLTNATTSFTVPIHGLLREYPIPALRPDLYDGLLVAMSAAARRNAIYVVINGRESVDCRQPQQGEDCPEQQLYIFNTNVVIDRNGSVIDRYRKINLFGEATHTPSLKPDLGVFTTDFGVTFGHYICFDLMFQVPAIQVVRKHNIKDIIFSTMWFSELPYLTAVQIQEAYAYTMDVNFLGAGANNVRVGSGGSGIYSGKAGALVSIMPGLPTTRLLVAKVPKVPGNVADNNYPGPIYDNPSDHDNLRMLQDPSISAHVTRPLVQGLQEFTIVDKDVSCRFRVRLNNKSNTAIQYRALATDGSHTYSRREIGVTSCLLVACKIDEPTSCPYRFNHTEEATIEELEIEMNTYGQKYNRSLECEDVVYFPLSFRYNKFPLSPENFTYGSTKLNNKSDFPECEIPSKNDISIFQNDVLNLNAKETLIYKLIRSQNELVAFGIWGRLYNRDKDHNKGVTDEDIEKFETILNHIYGESIEAGAFSGVRTYSGLASGGTRICAVFACTGEFKDTCGNRFQTYEDESTAIFEDLTIVATMPRPVVMPDFDVDDSVIFPVSASVSIMPLEPRDYTYYKNSTGHDIVYTLSLNTVSADLYTFGVWGRLFTSDGEDPHPPVDDPSSATVHLLSRSLFMSILIWLTYYHKINIQY